MTNILLKRGTSNAISNYIGKAGEIVLDSLTNHIIIQDGSTKGGIKVANISGISSSSSKSYIVETYHSGNNWYRIYSDGFKEQGRITSNIATGTTITFLKSYTDIPTVNFIVNRNATPDADSSGHWIQKISTSNFTITSNWSSSTMKIPVHYISFGY